ncbi:phage tail protein [Pasteurella multocida]|uniref:phage tail protein n=1 Tax=Pasteurella multocida TaxID=747 RepID=UPI001898ED56|nr:phage tail protein [Pasteurella multocida]MBF6985706.1 tail fiber protein [Pasteurella multocida]MDA5607629.1 tail fiber protein [Pasteurella multocida subsp. multocida]MDA5615171.1 tail fiber protein [Pasteurella multocida]MDA5625090.1 tail fiber protein [Pasteurella multocida]
MYALDNDSGVQTMPEVKAKKFNHTDPRWFTEGGNGVAPSYPGADWFNIVQAELLNILIEANITPDKSQLNQITLAIKEVVKNSVAESLDGKANKKHTHSISDITDLEEALEEASKKGLPVGSIIGFDKAITPPGFLRCDGSTFSPSIYPDLYRARQNNNVLPNLTRSDVGSTSYFAVDDIPDGWIYFDDIATQVTQSTYPELYQHLVRKYGSISAVPKAQDRFIRNAGNGLSVGQIQDDAIRNITGEIDLSSLGSGNQFLEFGEGVNSQVFKGALIPQAAKWSSWSSDQSGGGNVPRGFKFDASEVVPVAEENRPKALVLKKCIKAKNNFDDVVFWIKAFGSIQNEGQMNAANLAQDIQNVRSEKADKTHTHSYLDITNFTTGVASTYQGNFQENGWRKSSDGFIEQWGKVLLNPGSGSGTDNPINFPIAFPNKVLNVVMSYALMTDKRITQDPVLSALSETGMTIRQQSDRNVLVYWRAIGR